MCYLVYIRVKFLALCYKLCFQITFFFHLLFFISHPLPYLTLPITRQRQGLLSRRMVVSPEMRSVLNSLLLSVASCSKYSPSSLCVAACVAGVWLALTDVWRYGNMTLFLYQMKTLNTCFHIVFIPKALLPKLFNHFY